MNALNMWKKGKTTCYMPTNHMAEWNLFDVINSVILEFPAVLKFPADDL